jgi:hypothetical protein
MQTKTAVKVISLYDLFDKNMLIIFSTIHHIIILNFNYYYIDYLDDLILVYPQYQPIFQQFQINLEFCQAITLVTAFILYFIPKMLFKCKSKFTFTLDQIRVLIMVGSFVITPFNISNADFYGIKKIKSIKSIVGISPTMVLLFLLLFLFLKK